MLPSIPTCSPSETGPLDLLQHYYASQEAAEQFVHLQKRLLTKLNAVRKKLKNKEFALLKQLKASEAHEETKKQADLLMANVYRWVYG